MIPKKPVAEFFSDKIITNEQGGGQSHVQFRLDLADPYAMMVLGKVLEEGASRYAPDNWRKIDAKTHVNHALGHIFAYLANDPECDHLGHALCRLHMAVATKEHPVDADILNPRLREDVCDEY